jgi:hypothetical protein
MEIVDDRIITAKHILILNDHKIHFSTNVNGFYKETS